MSTSDRKRSLYRYVAERGELLVPPVRHQRGLALVQRVLLVADVDEVVDGDPLVDESAGASEIG